MKRGDISNTATPIVLISSSLLFVVTEKQKKASPKKTATVLDLLFGFEDEAIEVKRPKLKYNVDLFNKMERHALRGTLKFVIVTLNKDKEFLQEKLRESFLGYEVREFDSVYELRDFVKFTKRVAYYVDDDSALCSIVGDKILSFEEFRRWL